MSFIYNLPDEQLNPKQCETDSNALVIIGANGAGKSKLGAWIEQQDLENIHRIGAQRNLNFNENITLKSYSQAEDIVFWGTAEENQKNGKGYRWEWGKSYTTKLMNDFEDVLAALIALKNNENDNFVNQCKKAEETNNEKPHTPVTSIDKLSYIYEIGLQPVENKAVEKIAATEPEKQPSSGRKNSCAGVGNMAPSKVTEKYKRNKYHEVNYCYGEGESL